MGGQRHLGGGYRLRRRPHRGLGVEHLLDAAARHRRPGDHRHHEGGHDHRHQDLDQVAEVGDDRADLDVTGGHAVGAEPKHADAGQVDQHVDGGEHRGHQAPGPQRDVGEVLVGGGEATDLLRFAHEGPHHPDAGDLFPHDAVDLVDAVLHDPEGGDHPGHDDAEHDGSRGHADEEDGGQAHVLADGHDHAHDHRDGRRQSHRAGHDDEHLDLLDVVGDPGDERRRPVRPDLPGREAGDLVEEPVADVATEAHGHLGAVVHRRGMEADLDEGEDHHHAAHAPDVGEVPPNDAVVDDVGVEGGQGEGRRGLDRLQHDHAEQDVAVGPELVTEQTPQHDDPLTWVP